MKILYDPSDRIESIDVMKGVGILLLLLSHSISGESQLKTWIFSFHMPLFFWCTGYLIVANHPHREALKGKLKTLIARKTLSVLVPYVIFSLMIVAYLFLLELLHSHTFDTTAFVENLLSIATLRGIESLWFLPCLLIAEVLFLLIYAHVHPWAGLLLICVASITLSFTFNSSLPGGVLGAIIRSTTGFVFICVGFWANTLREKRGITLPPCTDILLIVTGAILSYLNGFAAIGIYQFGFVPAFYISAVLTLQGGVGLCSRVHHLQVVPFFGQNSIVVLCTNNVIIEILRLLDSKLGGNFFLSHGMLGNFLFAALLAAIETPVILVGMKYFRCFFGVFPLKNTVTVSECEKM